MARTYEEILQDARELSQEERELLVLELTSDLDREYGDGSELSSEWQSEIDRRKGAMESGEARLRDSQEVMTELEGLVHGKKNPV